MVYGQNGEAILRLVLKNKTLVRIDLDPNLKKAWDFEKNSSTVQEAIDKGLPKTKIMDIPFRMEMSGFARLENSIPIVADIGIVWPVIAVQLEEKLGIELDFLSFPQNTDEGQKCGNGLLIISVRLKKTSCIK